MGSTRRSRTSQAAFLEGYALLDSGRGTKLERFGDRVLMRPSSLAIWERRHDFDEWKQADAVYTPDKGWSFKDASFESWPVNFGSFSMNLNLQKNGQVGLFPEHASYLPLVRDELKRFEKMGAKPIRVLNLFAYTGMATAFCARHGGHVCHVDLSKTALTWAESNLRASGVPKERIRLIADDALKFLEREVERENTYHIVIADPPSFSRPSKSKTWTLDEVVVNFVKLCTQVVDREAGAILLSSHHFPPEVLANLLDDHLHELDHNVMPLPLAIPEEGTRRSLPAGGAVLMSW